MLYTGIDLHRRSIVVCTLNDQGSCVDHRHMHTRPELITMYFAQWPAQQQCAVVEATASW